MKTAIGLALLGVLAAGAATAEPALACKAVRETPIWRVSITDYWQGATRIDRVREIQFVLPGVTDAAPPLVVNTAVVPDPMMAPKGVMIFKSAVGPGHPPLGQVTLAGPEFHSPANDLLAGLEGGDPKLKHTLRLLSNGTLWEGPGRLITTPPALKASQFHTAVAATGYTDPQSPGAFKEADATAAMGVIDAALASHRLDLRVAVDLPDPKTHALNRLEPGLFAVADNHIDETLQAASALAAEVEAKHAAGTCS